MKIRNSLRASLYPFICGVVATILIFSTVVWYGILSYPLPWKVIDATEAGFSPVDFKFTDYSNDGDLFKTLNKMFPLGTNKQEVDKILVTIAHAKITKYSGKDFFVKNITDQRYYYEYRGIRSILLESFFLVPVNEFTWKVSIVFDKEENLVALNVI